MVSEPPSPPGASTNIVTTAATALYQRRAEWNEQGGWLCPLSTNHLQVEPACRETAHRLEVPDIHDAAARPVCALRPTRTRILRQNRVSILALPGRLPSATV